MELQAHRTLRVVLIVNYVSFHLNQVLFCKLGDEVAFGICKTANSIMWCKKRGKHKNIDRKSMEHQYF